MSYETIAENVKTLNETEKLELITIIVNSIKQEKSSSSENSKKLNFPHINKNKPISKETLDLVIGKLPKNFDVEKVQDEMWEEFAK